MGADQVADATEVEPQAAGAGARGGSAGSGQDTRTVAAQVGSLMPGVWDEISLVGLTERGYHGVFDHERRTGQEFTVDVVVYTDVRAAARGDALQRTINYADVAEIAADHIVGPPVQLIETLAERIADDILAAPGTMGVRVTVHKPKAPIAREFTDVSVTITRWAGAGGEAS